MAPPPPTYETLWSNDGSGTAGEEPGTAVSLFVSGGVFSVILGNTSLAGMNTLPAKTFDISPILLLVWFNGGNGFKLLSPDQPITATPYAMQAKIAASVAAEAISGTINSDQIDGSIGLWSSAEGNFFTTGPVGIGVANPQARLQVLGNMIVGDPLNEASGFNSFVSGGSMGEVSYANRASGSFSFVGGGSDNAASGRSSFLGGGRGNTAVGNDSFVGGGISNTATQQFSFIGGGSQNTASGVRSFVGGGNGNTASGGSSFVGGGWGNTASGLYSFIGGGESNEAIGWRSFAAGLRAKAAHNGTFVWADNTAADFSTTTDNQFLIRASGGVGIGRSFPRAAVHVKALDANQAIILESGNSLDAWGIGTNLSNGNLSFYRASNYALSYNFRASINATTGAYVSSSDEKLKSEIEPAGEILNKVLSLQPSTYRFNESGDEIERSYGFIAQEVREIFPEIVHQNEETGYLDLSYSDFSVLAIQAIKEQQEIIDAQAEEIGRISGQLAALSLAAEQNDRLEKRLAALENLLSGEPLVSR